VLIGWEKPPIPQISEGGVKVLRSESGEFNTVSQLAGFVKEKKRSQKEGGTSSS